FQGDDGIRDFHVTGVQTCALPIFSPAEEKVLLAGSMKQRQYVHPLNRTCKTCFWIPRNKLQEPKTIDHPKNHWETRPNARYVSNVSDLRRYRLRNHLRVYRKHSICHYDTRRRDPQWAIYFQ